MAALGTVILVPGFLGSALSYYHPLGRLGQRLLWMNPIALLGGAFPLLALPLADQPQLPGARLGIVPGGPMGAYYGLLDAYLESRGWQVESPAGDFRRSIEYDGFELSKLISRYAAKSPVQIVCHSRGGLVTRWAIGYLTSVGRPALVSRVIGLGVPHRGSLNAVQALAGYAHAVKALVNLGLTSRHYTGYGLGLGTVRHVLRSWPATAELMPDPVRWPYDLASIPPLYTADAWRGADPAPYTPYLDAAKAAWAALPDTSNTVEWIDVVGTGSYTSNTLPAGRPLTEEHAMGGDYTGDGAVSYNSAHIPGRRRISTPTAHDMLPNDGRLWALIHLALSGGLGVNVDLTGDVLRLPLT